MPATTPDDLGQCEYIQWIKNPNLHSEVPLGQARRHNKYVQVLCQNPATVIVAGPKPGENPQRLCSDHEAIVAEESFADEVERRQPIQADVQEMLRLLSDRLYAVEQRIEVLETKQANRKLEERKLLREKYLALQRILNDPTWGPYNE